MIKEIHVEAFSDDLRSKHLESTLSGLYRNGNGLPNLHANVLVEKIRNVARARLPTYLAEDQQAVDKESRVIMQMLAADNMTWESFCIAMMIHGAKRVRISIDLE